jgi:hypothetical protein
MAEEIKKTHKIVQDKLSESNYKKDIMPIEEIIALPLSEAYWKLLSPMRYDKVNMKNTAGQYNLTYNGQPI